ncbi:hypothetical protein G7054_g12389 [Neopestalotiopsis clavispora]|nr:hypothetical protein G7054_g12389 [Neopestalotiopsis clavispora]
MSKQSSSNLLATTRAELVDDLAELRGIDRVNASLQWATEKYKDSDNQDWMREIIPYLTIHSHALEPYPRVNFRLTVQPVHCNQMGNLHGGCTSTIFDSCTTWPLHLINKPGFWMYMGVSRTLNCTYLKPIPLGTTVEIQCEILSIGKRLATMKGEMRAVGEDGTLGPLLAVCEHGKVSTDAQFEKL